MASTSSSTSASAFYVRSIMDMASLRNQAEKMQAQISSGNRLERSSDDPVAASRLRVLRRASTLSGVDEADADRATADLNLADLALTSLVNCVYRAKDLATQAANGTLTAKQRASLGEEMQQIHGNLVALANSRDSAGHALFGGETAGDAYTLDASGNVTYAGTPTSGDLSLGDGQIVNRGLTGPEFLNFSVNGTPTDLLSVVKRLAADLKGAADAQAAARDGIGALTKGLDKLTAGQTLVGTRLNWINLTADRRTVLGELRAKEQHSIGGTDLPSTIARLQQTLLRLEAAQAAFSRLSNLSLFR